MASRPALLSTAATAVVVVVGALLPVPATASPAKAAIYVVGSISGWDEGVDYDAWASGKTFKVGDKLKFIYPTEGEGEDTHHHVLLVDEQNYSECTVPGGAQPLTSGEDTVTLSQAGKWFFICDVDDHCHNGMKLAITVIN